jgi:hypothetical protein
LLQNPLRAVVGHEGYPIRNFTVIAYRDQIRFGA